MGLTQEPKDTALRTEKARREHFTVNCSLETKLGIGVHEELGVFLASKFRESQFTTETGKKIPISSLGPGHFLSEKPLEPSSPPRFWCPEPHLSLS